MTNIEWLKKQKIINYNVIKHNKVWNEVEVTIEITDFKYNDPYDASKGHKFVVRDHKRRMRLTTEQIIILKNF